MRLNTVNDKLFYKINNNDIEIPNVILSRLNDKQSPKTGVNITSIKKITDDTIKKIPEGFANTFPFLAGYLSSKLEDIYIVDLNIKTIAKNSKDKSRRIFIMGFNNGKYLAMFTKQNITQLKYSEINNNFHVFNPNKNKFEKIDFEKFKNVKPLKFIKGLPEAFDNEEIKNIYPEVKKQKSDLIIQNFDKNKFENYFFNTNNALLKIYNHIKQLNINTKAFKTLFDIKNFIPEYSVGSVAVKHKNKNILIDKFGVKILDLFINNLDRLSDLLKFFSEYLYNVETGNWEDFDFTKFNKIEEFFLDESVIAKYFQYMKKIGNKTFDLTTLTIDEIKKIEKEYTESKNKNVWFLFKNDAYIFDDYTKSFIKVPINKSFDKPMQFASILDMFTYTKNNNILILDDLTKIFPREIIANVAKC